MSYTEIKNYQVTTAKKHDCVWCGEDIPVGSPSQYRVYIFESVFHNDWMHPECYSAMMNSCDVALEEGFYPGDNERGKEII